VLLASVRHGRRHAGAVRDPQPLALMLGSARPTSSPTSGAARQRWTVYGMRYDKACTPILTLQTIHMQREGKL
jgi:hypothetical protein